MNSTCFLVRVDEWVEDTFHPSYEGAPTESSALVTDADRWRRMVRTASWSDAPESLRSASRNAGKADGRTYDHVGFRVARTIASGGSLFECESATVPIKHLFVEVAWRST